MATYSQQLDLPCRVGRAGEGQLVAESEQPPDQAQELFTPVGRYSLAAADRQFWPQVEFRWAAADTASAPLTSTGSSTASPRSA